MLRALQSIGPSTHRSAAPVATGNRRAPPTFLVRAFFLRDSRARLSCPEIRSVHYSLTGRRLSSPFRRPVFYLVVSRDLRATGGCSRCAKRRGRLSSRPVICCPAPSRKNSRIRRKQIGLIKSGRTGFRMPVTPPPPIKQALTRSPPGIAAARLKRTRIPAGRGPPPGHAPSGSRGCKSGNFFVSPLARVVFTVGSALFSPSARHSRAGVYFEELFPAARLYGRVS